MAVEGRLFARSLSMVVKLKTRIKAAIAQTVIVCCLGCALLTLVALGSPAAATTLKQYGKVLVLTETEDTTSEFHYIYFYNQNNKLVRLIDVWNGGCCQAPSAHDYAIDGEKSEYTGSFILETKEGPLVRDILCTNLPTSRIDDPPKLELETLKSILEEAVPFAGCK